MFQLILILCETSDNFRFGILSIGSDGNCLGEWRFRIPKLFGSTAAVSAKANIASKRKIVLNMFSALILVLLAGISIR